MDKPREDRSLDELLAAATPVDNGYFWPEDLTATERELVRDYLMELYGING